MKGDISIMAVGKENIKGKILFVTMAHYERPSGVVPDALSQHEGVQKRQRYLDFTDLHVAQPFQYPIEIPVKLTLRHIVTKKTFGAGSRTRTDKTVRSGDFKSPVYTNSTIPAISELCPETEINFTLIGFMSQCKNQRKFYFF